MTYSLVIIKHQSDPTYINGLQNWSQVSLELGKGRACLRHSRKARVAAGGGRSRKGEVREEASHTLQSLWAT